jgi:hypothetical protein
MFTNAKLETSCKNEREPAKIAIYSVYYTNKNGGDRLRKMLISWIFEEENSKTAGLGKCKQADLDFV